MRLENPRQEAFCQELSKCGNATEAYIRAGYKVKNANVAKSAASRLLADVRVRARIKELDDSREKDSIADADEQKSFVTSVMRGEVKECNGKPVSIAVRLKAAELLGKMQGLYINKVETDVNVRPVIIHDDL